MMYAVEKVGVGAGAGLEEEAGAGLRWPLLVRESGVDGGCEASADVTAEPSGDELESVKRTYELTRETADRKGGATCGVTTNTDNELDELQDLGDRCAQAYMESDVLLHRAMKLLVEFHHKRGWKDSGLGSTAEWLAWRIGIKPGAARERLRTALALEELPQTSEAMERGELSFTKVRALTRVATAENEGVLLEFARAGSANNLERVVRAWKTMDRRSEVSAEQARHRTRRFSAWVDETGMVVVKGRLDPEVGAVLMQAVDAASDALFRKEWQEKRPTPLDDDEIKPEQRRADAVGLIAERALAAGFAGVRGGAGGRDAAGDGTAPELPISGSRAERFQVMHHVDADTLREDGDPGISELSDGTRVSAETSRRLACDCALVPIGRDGEGQITGAGRRIRTVNPNLRRALEARDRGCRFPGCGGRFPEAHHVRHWADGGETTLNNLVLLCRDHHRAVHEGGVRVCLDSHGQAVFFTPQGKVLAGAAPRGWDDLRRDDLKTGGVAGNGAPSVPVPQPRPHPTWKYDKDMPWEVEARAWEALDPS